MELIINRIKEICDKSWNSYPTNNIKFEHFILSVLVDKKFNCLENIVSTKKSGNINFLNLNDLLNESVSGDVSENIVNEITTSLYHESNIVYKTRPKIMIHSDFISLIKYTLNNNNKENKDYITACDLLISFLNIPLVEGPSFLSVKTMFIGKSITSSKIINYISSLNETPINIINEPEDNNEIKNIQKNNNKNKLKNYTQINKSTDNLNMLVYNDKLEKTIGRENELMRLISILGKKRKNNVLIIGDSGVGKTNIVHGLTHKIVNGDVPFYLNNKIILNFNHSNMIAGTQFRGMLEEKLNQLFSEITKAKDIILFIDDLTKLYGNNSSSGQTEMIDVFNEVINKGDIQIITSCDYQKFKILEKNISFLNKFEKIYLDEVNDEDSIKILMGVKDSYESFHNVFFSNEIIKTVNKLSKKYITDKKIPESALDVIDECGSMFRNCNKDKYKITEDNILTIISNMTNIPMNRLGYDEKKDLKDINIKLKEHIIGQDNAIETISQAIKRNRLGINKKNKPSTFLCVGNTGVGKTFLAKKIAYELFGSEDKLIRFDMSEYSEKNSVSKLIGTSPGYIGFEKGGLLTEAVKHNKYCVLLFDEIEKADSEIYNLFLQLFDDGILTDGNGYKVDFKNTIIMMTSNIGTRQENDYKYIGFKQIDKPNNNIITKEIEKYFTPEFLNRIDEIIYFNKLEDNDLIKIAEIGLDKLKKSLIDNLNVELIYNEEVSKHIHSESLKSKKYGARPISRLITNKIENLLSDYFLDNDNINKVELILKEGNIIIK